MKFDTLLKLGSHAAQLYQHNSFQEMTKMIHNGVKRRAADPHHWMHGPQLPYSPDHFSRHGGHFAPLPTYRSPRAANGTSQSAATNANGPQLKHLLTPENMQAVRQLLNGIGGHRTNNK